MRQPGAQRGGRRDRHHPGPAVARAAAVRRPPGAVGGAGPRSRAWCPRRSSEVLRFEPITPFTARICTEPIEHRGVTVPGGHDRRDLRRAGQPRRWRGGDEFDITRDSGRPAAHVRRGPALLPGLQPGPGRTGGGAHLPARPDAGPAPGGPESRLGDVEGIYGIDSLPSPGPPPE